MAKGRGSSEAMARTFRVALGVVAVLQAALIVAFLVGSLIFSGGKVSEAMDAKWGVLIPYPLFVVPTALVVVLGILAVALAFAVASTNRSADEEHVQRLIGPLLASAVGAFLFSILAPDGGLRTRDFVIGGQWIGSVLAVVALGVLLLGILAARRRDAARSGQRAAR